MAIRLPAGGIDVAVGFDGRGGGCDALTLGRLLATDVDGGRLTVVVSMPFPPSTLGEQRGSTERSATWAELCDRLREHGHDLVRDAAGPLLEGTAFEQRIVLDDSPARGLAGYVADEAPDILAVGSTHRGKLGRVFAGSIPTKLLSGAECAVAVAPREYRERPDPAISRISVGFDGRPESERALLEAVALAVRLGATLRVLAIVEPSSSLEYELTGAALRDALEVLGGQGLRDRRGEELEAGAAMILDQVPAEIESEILVLHGDPTEHLVAGSSESCDLLVLGSRGYGPIGRTLLGSTSTRVLREATVPVLVHPRP